MKYIVKLNDIMANTHDGKQDGNMAQSQPALLRNPYGSGSAVTGSPTVASAPMLPSTHRCGEPIYHAPGGPCHAMAGVQRFQIDQGMGSPEPTAGRKRSASSPPSVGVLASPMTGGVKRGAADTPTDASLVASGHRLLRPRVEDPPTTGVEDKMRHME